MSLVFLVFFISSLCVALSSPANAQSINLPDWMAQYSYLFNETLDKAVLPGSHDSGSYHLSDTVGILNTGDPVINALIELANKLKLPVWEVLMPWSLTQGNITSSQTDKRLSHQSVLSSTGTTSYSSIYNQAMFGMRYFDLRLAYVTANSAWAIQHGLLGVDIRTCLNDFADFLSNHKGELVIIEMGHVEFVNQTTSQLSKHQAQSSNPAYDQLISLIQSILGQWLVPCNKLNNQTVNQLVKANTRALVAVDSEILQGQSISNICDASQVLYNTYADTPDVSKMIDYNNQVISQFNQQSDFTATRMSHTAARHQRRYDMHDRQSRKQQAIQAVKPLWKVSYTLTPDTDTILESVIPGYPHSLLDLADKGNKQLTSFMQAINKKGLQAGNIVLVDDAANSDVVQGVLSNLIMKYNQTTHRL